MAQTAGTVFDPGHNPEWLHKKKAPCMCRVPYKLYVIEIKL